MLSFTIYAADLAEGWTSRGSAWCAGRSVIAPFRHPAVHTDVLVSPGRSAVIVRESVRGADLPTGGYIPLRCTEREFDRLLAETRRWPLDFVLLTLTHAGEAPGVRLTCGRWGTAPLYLHAGRAVLRGDWDVTELYAHLRSTALDPGFAAQYLLSLEHPYSRKTIFPEIAMLTERASASWRAPFEAPKVRYPSPEEQASATRLKRGADVDGAFREILTASMRRWLPQDDEEIALELSGGLDSSTVAAAAASLTTQRVRSYGMIMPGEPGNWQRRRRDAVARRLRLIDRSFPCADLPPFNPRSPRVREDATVPWGEFYDEAVGALLDLARGDGAQLIFTGMGGDELCSYQAGELDDDDRALAFGEEASEVTLRTGGGEFPSFVTQRALEAFEQRDALVDDAPQPLMYVSTLESAAAVSTLYLAHGMWPVSPLVTPELVQFCRRLPFELRHERVVQRRVLTSYGMGRTVAYPSPKRLENFCEVMSFALREASVPTIAPLFAESRLAEQGFVDGGKLVRAYRRARSGDERYDDQLLGAAVLELTLRAVESRRARSRTSRSVAAGAGRAAL
jgi:asparagine synthase (glutamine-hydrolysing)